MIEDFSKQNQVATPEEKFLSNFIETVHIDDNLKCDLILCWYGFKPATEISLMNQEQCSQFEDFCIRSGFHFLRMTSLMIQKSGAHISTKRPAYIISRNERDLEELGFLLEGKGDSALKEGRDAAFGTVYGFPATAVAMFNDESRRVKWDHTELPEGVRAGEILPFVQFILSKDNWQAELAEVEKWAQAIKKISPPLYDRIILEYRGRNQAKDFKKDK